MDNDSQSSSYKILKDDLELQEKLIDEYVSVSTINNCIHKGFMHSIDPISQSMILSIPQKDQYQTIIIPGHAILDVAKEVLIEDYKPPQRKPTPIFTKEDLLKRKKKVIAWFETNLLPVTELDDKIVVGDVSLLAPYNVSDLCTLNSIVATEIKKLLAKMPDDLDSC